MEDIKFWMNFVVENSNKLQKNGFRKENELSVFTLGSNNTCYLIYPWRKVLEREDGMKGAHVPRAMLDWWY